MRAIKAALAAAATLALAANAQAATPRGWNEHDRRVGEACLAATSLQRAKVSGMPVVFDDSVGYTALLITGRYPQPRIRHLSGRELCLFHRASGAVHLSDAERFGTGRQ